MPSLRHLLDAHPRLLLIDSASARIQAGLWLPGDRSDSARWQASEAEAGTGIFACVETLCTSAGVRLAELDAFAFCEGPGSVLGIRTAAMALRTWRVLNPAPTYAYRSLDLVANALGDPATQVIADARRDAWHVAHVGQPLRRVATADLPAGERLLMPAHFRHWTPLPPTVENTPYDVAALLGKTVDLDLFRATTEPDAFLHEEPGYVTWTPQIHRAPA